MSVNALTRGLLSRLTVAHSSLAAYIQLRRAQGSVSVSENDRLRESLFALAQEMRDRGECLCDLSDRDARTACHHAEEALSSAALCLMSGRYDCPSYIAVNVDKLEHSLDVLTYCTRCLSEYSTTEQA